MTRKAYRSSASQVNTKGDCTRKWGFEKIDKIASPPNRYAAFGSRTHKLLEEWFRKLVPPPDTQEGRTARNILRHLPPPQTQGILIEREIDLVLGGVPFKGYVDFSIFEGRVRPFVSDHKTCGNFTYVLMPDTMPDDVQVANYSYEAMLRTNSQEVDVQWTYGTRDGKKSLPVVSTVTYEQIKPRLEKTAQAAADMRTIYESGVSAIELPYDASACDKYGGCPFQDICNLSPQERIQSIMSQGTQESAFLTKLRNKKGGKPAATHPPPAATTEATPDVAETTPPAPSVPTTSGTVNPPSAPTAAAASPEELPAKPAKKARAKRSKKAPVVPGAAASPTPPHPQTDQPGNDDMVPMSDVRSMVELLTDQYRKGFNDGLKFGGAS